jgi:hypothetical protein
MKRSSLQKDDKNNLKKLFGIQSHKFFGLNLLTLLCKLVHFSATEIIVFSYEMSCIAKKSE